MLIIHKNGEKKRCVCGGGGEGEINIRNISPLAFLSVSF